ncbi:hypothetical protein [Asticcacaulis sp. AND118]|uniref:hypothetical protein n=1 Tax=Asticcacaulis sp. AND118 TaxID=2840468 RepID=UPI001CFF6894|nr:hypothetical protein [Asticcacaulis sp. AND118]UDF02255.1 hypothetical protein LH365_07270 [Asticcacaulis sp. AND118]
MLSQFRINHRIDPDKNLLMIAVRGPYSSDAFVGGLIDLYKSLGHPWTYDRIMDMRSAEGVVELADLMRASKWLAEAAGTPPPPRKRLALISSDPFDRARMNALGDAFPKAYVQLFDNRDEALEWLSTPSE